MKIHEYQGKEIFRKYGLPTPRGFAAFNVDEAVEAAKKLGGKVWVVKAQIHAGGRGKGGGVKLARSADEAERIAGEMLGMTLITHQTGPEGRVVSRVLVEEGLQMTRELYLSLVLDRASGKPVMMASAAGGMDIEEVAAATPEKIVKVFIEPGVGLVPFESRRIGFAIGLDGPQVGKAIKLMSSLYDAFVATDASLVEINPLVVTASGDLLALDAKVNFDDNASFRHHEWQALHDAYEEDPVELAAKRAGLSYVSLDGDIGCLVNGAGLAMATMDIILHYGGSPANFLDVGGGASQDQVKRAFEMILQSGHVRGIFVNIFGGIMRCDVVAAGVIAATKELGLKVPLVVRLEGTNVEAGRKLLDESGLTIQSATSMADGAQKIVAATRRRRRRGSSRGCRRSGG